MALARENNKTLPSSQISTPSAPSPPSDAGEGTKKDTGHGFRHPAAIPFSEKLSTILPLTHFNIVRSFHSVTFIDLGESVIINHAHQQLGCSGLHFALLADLELSSSNQRKMAMRKFECPAAVARLANCDLSCLLLRRLTPTIVLHPAPATTMPEQLTTARSRPTDLPLSHTQSGRSALYLSRSSPLL
ncbi:hypothetical protein KSP40_PGU006434 [Platanthera guangdongensis]|uniref:Uncharacterized protein n=1 Tax=Platanthera guangdongensis TaxID=2320717 RepID=A0ABR2MJP0_9ASPA